jgi:hypothetical protein
LLNTHRWLLTPADLASIDEALEAFAADGPAIHYSRGRPESQPGPSYRVLMTARDVSGLPRSFLASDEAFTVVKDLESRNLIVPIVGDFGNPGAIARVGDYVRQRGSRVSAFYGSNVEVYLTNHQRAAYCTSLASLPAMTGAWYVGGRGAVTLATRLRTCPRVAETIEWRPPA